MIPAVKKKHVKKASLDLTKKTPFSKTLQTPLHQSSGRGGTSLGMANSVTHGSLMTADRQNQLLYSSRNHLRETSTKLVKTTGGKLPFSPLKPAREDPETLRQKLGSSCSQRSLSTTRKSLLMKRGRRSSMMKSQLMIPRKLSGSMLAHAQLKINRASVASEE